MVRFAVVFIICFFIQLFIWYLFISKQLQKHHIRKSDIKKLISNLCGGNHNEFNRHCINLSTDENLLLVISVIIIFPIVMTIIIDVAIEAHNWSMLLIFSLSGFCGMNSEFFKKYGVYIELCLNELISYIEIINSGESIHQPKPNIIMIHNTNYQNPTETKAALAQKKGQKNRNHSIVIKGNLFNYNPDRHEQYINEICQKYKLTNIVIEVSKDFNAHATIIDNVPHIFVGEGLKKSLDDVSLLFVIGHEMGHIYYGDLGNRGNDSFVDPALIKFLALYWCALMPNFFSSYFDFWVAVIVLLSIIYMDRVFYMSYDNEYYCKQIRELRADRFGFNVLNSYVNDADKSIGILKNEIVNDEPNEPTSVPFIEALLIRYKILPALEDCHPSWKFRVDEMERNKSRTKWVLIDDMYYTWKFSFGIMFSNRWRLK